MARAVVLLTRMPWSSVSPTLTVTAPLGSNRVLMATRPDNSRSSKSRWSSNSEGCLSAEVCLANCLFIKANWLVSALAWPTSVSTDWRVSLSMISNCPANCRKRAARPSASRKKMLRETTEAGSLERSRADSKKRFMAVVRPMLSSPMTSIRRFT